jgi:hypothetical protein
MEKIEFFKTLFYKHKLFFKEINRRDESPWDSVGHFAEL